MLQELMIARGRNDGTIRVEGSIAAHNANAFAQVLEQDVVALANRGAVDLDLHDLELADEDAIAMALNGIRGLVARHRVILRHAPEVLARKLNEAFDLSTDPIELIDPRGGHPPTLM